MTLRQPLYRQVAEFTVGVLGCDLVNLWLPSPVSLLRCLEVALLGMPPEIARAIVLATTGVGASMPTTTSELLKEVTNLH